MGFHWSSRVLGSLVVFSLFIVAGSSLWGETGDELWTAAEMRIEKYRKGDVIITVRDKDGRPVPNAKVRLQQTRH
ncbi:MAG TPA: hypothetical protein PL064_10860, partial [Thermogutta sp.]|nr:hypothetical protein [Thermogutta sp.]